MFLNPLRVFPIDTRGQMGVEYDDARFEAKLGYRSTIWIVRQPVLRPTDHNSDMKPSSVLVSGGVRLHEPPGSRLVGGSEPSSLRKTCTSFNNVTSDCLPVEDSSVRIFPIMRRSEGVKNSKSCFVLVSGGVRLHEPPGSRLVGGSEPISYAGNVYLFQ